MAQETKGRTAVERRETIEDVTAEIQVDTAVPEAPAADVAVRPPQPAEVRQLSRRDGQGRPHIDVAAMNAPGGAPT